MIIKDKKGKFYNQIKVVNGLYYISNPNLTKEKAMANHNVGMTLQKHIYEANFSEFIEESKNPLNFIKKSTKFLKKIITK